MTQKTVNLTFFRQQYFARGSQGNDQGLQPIVQIAPFPLFISFVCGQSTLQRYPMQKF